MFRFPILAALALSCSCAHDITEPVSQAPNLLALLASEPSSGSCTGIVKLEGAIGDPSDFVAAIKACADRPVVVEVNSPGGSVFGALEIQKAIERHPHAVVCLVDGIAASAAFTTLQACDVRLMTNRSILMVHHASIPANGQVEQHDNAAAALRALDRGMILHCAKRMGMVPEDLEAKIAGGKEWWMGLEEAVLVHAVDFEGATLFEAERLAREAVKQ